MKPCASSLRPAIAGLLLALGSAIHAADQYTLGPDSLGRGPNVAAGSVRPFSFAASKIYPDTTRDGWVYVPAQYDAAKPAALMIFQDGQSWLNTNGQIRASIVLDNLIARGDMPVTVGVFINPGLRGTNAASTAPGSGRSNRSFEYDSLGDAYAKFLINELLPFVTAEFKLNLSSDPSQRALAGSSSGGICAFTVAWERPSSFGKVLSHIGSFVNIRGGHNYPALIRKTERKPIRVFLQDGSNDLNNLHGNWPLANQEMASSFAFAGYEYRFVFGDGSHNNKHGGSILPESLRWLWRPESVEKPKPIIRDNLAGDEALSKVLADGGHPGDWELVGDQFGFTDGACADAEGNFYFSDLPKGVLHRIAAGEKQARPWLENGPKISGMKFGPDRALYAATQGTVGGPQGEPKQIIRIEAASKQIEVVATGVQPNDLVVSRAGQIYFTDTGAGAVVRVPISARGMARPVPVAGGINRPNGIALSPDHSQLIVSEYGGTNVWTFLIAADGSLHGGERNMETRCPAGKADSGGDGMITDAQGRSWVTSHLGIQMFDAGGRMGGVMPRPQEKATVSAAFAGPGHAYLYVCSSDKVYRRKTLTHGAGFDH